MDKLEEQLKNELLSLKKSRKILLVATCLLLPFVLFYLSWIYLKVKDLTRPQSIASMLRYQIQSQLPGLTGNLTESLKTAAPELANEFGKTLKGNIPVLRRRLEVLCEETIRSMIYSSEERIQEIFSDLLVSGSGELYAEILDSFGDKETARKFCSDIFEGALQELDEQIEKEIAIGLDDILQISSETFETVLGKLEHLGSKKELTRSETLQKEFIMVLMEFFRKSFIFPESE